ncbi:uncharacterized protein LOC129946540 isoform X1 [Eupeodes corollae]|uniref:uncharacterized protein LOC129946540 isoform X1 n=1 Tax=Eupeodes corollae TaxID=290404 RepID=UPI002493B4E5|nr:uncharacterized protein LOC129946540 isoform X1 [Eupeodes corollae]
MHLFKYSVVLLTVCLLLANKVKETESGSIFEDITTGGLPILASMAGLTFTGPIAPIIVGSLLTISLAAKLLQENNQEAEPSPLSKADFLEQNSKISDSLKDIKTQMSQMGTQLTDTVETHELFEDMRNALDTLCETVTDNYDTIMDPKVKGVSKAASLRAMLEYFSTFRQTLKSFVTKYIKPKGMVSAAGDVNLFYDYILRRNRVANENGDDCYFEAVHTKLFKSYMYILKSLTDAYVMVISAHTVQYQSELKESKESEAHETKKLSIKILNQYKSDMKALMEKTKWALNQAPRDIRSCGKFEYMRKGDSFDSVSFAVIFPKFKDWNYDRNAHYSMFSGPSYQCLTREPDVKSSDFEITNCTDAGLKRPAAVKAFVDPKKTSWPLVYLFSSPSFGADQTLGHSVSTPGLVKREFSSTKSCFSEFCNAYKKKVVGVSTKLVSAEEGSVITGVRFVIKDNIIHIEIQEAPFVDDLNIDKDYLYWTEQPKSDEVLYLDSKIRNFELGDVELPPNQYIKTIQFKLKNEEEGLIGLYINGITSERIGQQWYPGAKSSEIPLAGSESPDKFADAKHLVSKPPLANRPYHVSLQPTDLYKEFGISTVPNFDLRSVSSYPAAPVAGIGMYHHTVKGSGGFLALKLIQPNMAPYVDYNVIEKVIDTLVKL